MFNESEKLFVVDSVSLRQTTHIENSVQDYFLSFKNLQNFLPYHEAVIQFVETRNVENPEANELVVEGKATALVKSRRGGYLFE